MQGPNPLHLLDKRSQRRILLAIGLGIMMTSFESSAVGTILPIIDHAFNNTGSAQWVVTFYLLMMSAFLLAAGCLGDVLGYRKVYLLGLKIFFVGAVLSSTSLSLISLACFRMVEGLGAVMILANSAGIVTRYCTPTSHGHLLGLLSSMAYVGLTFGPIISGWLTKVIGWRIIFVLPLILAVASHVLSTRVLPRENPGIKTEHVNIAFALLFATSLAFLMIALNQIHRSNLQSIPVLFLAACAILGTLFAVRCGLSNDLKLLYSWSFSSSAIASILSYVALNSVVFILPFYLIEVQSLNSLRVGFILSVRPALTALIAPVSGGFDDRYPSWNLSIFGLIIFLLALINLTAINDDSNIALLVSVAGMGIGMGIFIAPNHSIIMRMSLVSHKGAASAIIPLTRNLGMLFGATLAGVFFSNKPELKTHLKSSMILVSHTIFDIASCIIASAVLIVMINTRIDFMRANSKKNIQNELNS